MGNLLISQERDPETHAIIGAAMEVHRELGPGFLEPVYQEALMMEFVQRQIPAKREVALVIHYKDKELDCFYRADFICYDRIVVEIKALAQIGGNEEAQVINYLRASDHEKGLLLNFGTPSLQFRRLILTKNHLRKSAQSADRDQ